MTPEMYSIYHQSDIDIRDTLYMGDLPLWMAVYFASFHLLPFSVLIIEVPFCRVFHCRIQDRNDIWGFVQRIYSIPLSPALQGHWLLAINSCQWDLTGEWEECNSTQLAVP